LRGRGSIIRCLATVFLLWASGTTGAKCSSLPSPDSRQKPTSQHGATKRRRRGSYLPTAAADFSQRHLRSWRKTSQILSMIRAWSLFISYSKNLCIWNRVDFLEGGRNTWRVCNVFYMRENCFDNCDRTCSFSESWLHCGRFTKWRCRCKSVLNFFDIN